MHSAPSAAPQPDDRSRAVARMVGPSALEGGAEPAASTFGAVRSVREVERIGIEFTGRGGEYFRIWLVNLLLMLVTFGIYYPWAKVRKLRYFYGHTQVGGHALDFHGEPRKMLRGTALMGVLFILYSIASEFSPLAGGVALLIIVGLWPALFRASMQFRLANTSWRGLRFHFLGSMRDAYLTFAWPLLAFAALGAAAGAFGSAAAGGRAGPGLLALPLLVVLGAVLIVPWFWFRLKRYQHDHYAYGSLRFELRSSVRAFYGVYLRVFLWTLPIVALIGALVVGTIAGAAGAARHPAAQIGLLLTWLPLVAVAVFVLQLAPRAYATAAMQNLVWSRTGNRAMRFKSELRFRSVWWLMVKNTVLVILTLGLYWPFAAVALARLRLEAVTLVTRVDLDRLSAAAQRPASGDAAGEAAADLFDIDFGL